MTNRTGRPRLGKTRTNFIAALYDTKDQIEELNTLNEWIQAAMEKLGVAKTPAFSAILLELIRFRTGKQSPDHQPANPLADIDSIRAELYEELRAAILADVKAMIGNIIQDDSQFEAIKTARARHAEGDDLEPITDEIINNMLEDLND